MKIASFPRMDNQSRNPYLFLLKNSLEMNEITIENSNSNHLSVNWLIKNKKHINVLHLHWIQYHYINIAKKRISIKLLINFIFNLIFARILNYKLVWTMHNVKPHENKYSKIDFFLRKLLSLLANSIITHCEYGKQYMKDKYKREKNVFVMQHPNYIDIYPAGITRNKAREKLGIPQDGLIFLFLGEIRNYKGLNLLINTFKEYNNTNAFLIIAGNPLFPETKNELIKLINNDKRIISNFTFIPDEDVQIYFKAADIMILPFTNITMSGSLLLAMSFAKPIIAPEIGGIKEYINTDSGILYDVKESKGLLDALYKSEKTNLLEMGNKGYEFIKQFTWDKLAKATKNIYTLS